MAKRTKKRPVINCCGKRLSTKFCPTCGKRRVDQHDLTTLLFHCRSRVSEMKAVVETLKQDMNEPRRAADERWQRRAKKTLKSRKAAVLKWSIWVKELAAIVKQRGG